MLNLENQMLYKRALYLALITIGYNFIEGIVSVLFGYGDETFTLFGFGLDSFVEVVSGIGIWHMTRRIAGSGDGSTDTFERQALRVTGTSFYLLAAGLTATAAGTAIAGHRPDTTFWGAVIGGVSIGTMWLLIRLKVQVGTKLGSAAILADAACTRTCLYLSVILLGASLLYEWTGLGLVDSAGSLAVAWFAWREGKEAFAKASGKGCCRCSCGS